MSSILTLTRWAGIVRRTGMLISRTVKAGGNGRDREEHGCASAHAHASGVSRVGDLVGTGSRLVPSLAVTVALSGLAVGCGTDVEQSSPPGKIVFAGDRNSIFVMNPDGTRVTRIGDGACPSFASDGSEIVVGGYTIAVMDPDGGNVRKLAHGGSTYPTFSPDGTRIAFTRGRAVFVMNADGGELKQLNVVPDPTGPVTGIVVPGAVIPVPSGRFLVEDPDGEGSTDRPAFSPDGSKILFARSSGVIWVMASDGTGARQLLPDDPNVNFAPVFTPDGAGIVFASNRAHNGRTGIYLMDVDGQNIRLLNDDDAAYPSFSPDGTKIVYTRFTRDPASEQGVMFSELWVMNSDGSKPHRLTDPKQSVQHAVCGSWGTGTDS
ncbi:TolB family protein [Nocardia sp. CA-107356]|uniref:TolB family protein n=1 Tax=Nocardia sp. CA-107356 TaxID=3239972 RepID=UPI003D93A3A3